MLQQNVVMLNLLMERLKSTTISKKCWLQRLNSSIRWSCLSLDLELSLTIFSYSLRIFLCVFDLNSINTYTKTKKYKNLKHEFSLNKQKSYSQHCILKTVDMIFFRRNPMVPRSNIIQWSNIMNNFANQIQGKQKMQKLQPKN